MADDKHYPRGGHGGSIEIIGESGIAEGGNGGRGGAPEHGRGGDGGGGTHVGPGYARGGDGGDAGRPGRPALGAPSSLCYVVDPFWLSLPGMTDIYGIPQPGKGGDSSTAYVSHGGYEYCLNVLLQLLNGPVPQNISNPAIIDAIDALGLEAGVQTGQQWWDLAIKHYPEETSAAMAHMRNCERR